ncbi:uncharacterized protein LOC131183975 isoform X2 [Ahaetulla prasina]|uniref:uncharacterized protein LOC131183975 isoform X2 n=1 Tax=Ahaetulla prasina TaxID=499056 RepID=UPI002648AAF8|nr:uncharacterized protein LOC131183975 isoform X2 [Ahaetulla prasina]
MPGDPESGAQKGGFRLACGGCTSDPCPLNLPSSPAELLFCKAGWGEIWAAWLPLQRRTTRLGGGFLRPAELRLLGPLLSRKRRRLAQNSSSSPLIRRVVAAPDELCEWVMLIARRPPALTGCKGPFAGLRHGAKSRASQHIPSRVSCDQPGRGRGRGGRGRGGVACFGNWCRSFGWSLEAQKNLGSPCWSFGFAKKNQIGTIWGKKNNNSHVVTSEMFLMNAIDVKETTSHLIRAVLYGISFGIERKEEDEIRK